MMIFWHLLPLCYHLFLLPACCAARSTSSTLAAAAHTERDPNLAVTQALAATLG
jgi:hypothetical protein